MYTLLSWLGLILAIVVIIGTRLISPELTEIQLLQQYWIVYLLAIALMTGSYALAKGKAE